MVRRVLYGIDEHRGTERASLYIHEKTKLLVKGQRFEASFDVVDMSPFGLGAVTLTPEQDVLLENGEPLTLELRRGQSIVSMDGFLTHKRPVTIQNQKLTRIGIKLFAGHNSRSLGEEKRTKSRYRLREITSITCSCEDPVNVGQKAFFSVEEAGYGGFTLKTSSRNKFLMTYTHLRFQIGIPGKEIFHENMMIRHVRSADEGRSYILGCQFISPSHRFLAALGDFSLSFAPDVTLHELRRAGFPIDMETQAITVRASDTQADFIQIMNLRLCAYQSEGRLLDHEDPHSQIDRFDAYSRQLVAKVGERVIAATRIVFNNGDRSRSEYESVHPLPEWLWEKGFVEISKLCTDPAFRGGAVFLRLGAEAFRLAVLEGASYIVVVCLDEMLSTYKRLGFKDSGTSFEHPLLKERITLLYGDIEKILSGEGIGFVYWCFLGVPLHDYLIHNSHRKPSLSLRLRLRLARWMRKPITRWLEKRRLARNVQQPERSASAAPMPNKPVLRSVD